MNMETQQYREKYKKRPFGNNLFDRFPPGGADVYRLCDAIDRLQQLVRDIQVKLPTDDQNEVESRLWNIWL